MKTINGESITLGKRVIPFDIALSAFTPEQDESGVSKSIIPLQQKITCCMTATGLVYYNEDGTEMLEEELERRFARAFRTICASYLFEQCKDCEG